MWILHDETSTSWNFSLFNDLCHQNFEATTSESERFTVNHLNKWLFIFSTDQEWFLSIDLCLFIETEEWDTSQAHKV